MSHAVEERPEEAPGASETPMIALIAGGAVSVASFFSAGAGLQMVVVIGVYGWPWWLALGLMAFGVAGMAAGGNLARARLGAALASLGISLGLAAAGLIWALFAFFNGLVNPLPFLSGTLSLLAGLLVPFALGPVRKTAEARRRLYA